MHNAVVRDKNVDYTIGLNFSAIKFYAKMDNSE